MTALTFPKSSTPGARPGEGAGRLVNVYSVTDGDRLALCPAPGLIPFALVAEGPRGFLLVGNLLYVAVTDRLYKVDGTGLATPVGNLPGSEPVTMARNGRSPAPDIAIVADGTAYVTNGTSVTDYPDPDVGSPISVHISGPYFVFDYGDGTRRASEINATDINDQSFTNAEAKPDGLVRGIPKGLQSIALGTASTEFYQNVGTQPFPFARVEVVDTGLFGPWAVSGFEDGWDRPWFMVASDRTVGRWDGYTFTRISTPAVERAIAGIIHATDLRMLVYTFGGNAVVSLSGPDFTWDYHVAADRWFERESYDLPRWRAQCSVNAFGRWLVGDTQSSNVMTIARGARREGDDPLVCTIEGKGPTFPKGARLSDYSVEVSTGQGREEGLDPIETEPCMLISWSLDGGGAFGNPVSRSMGRQGRYGRAVRVGHMGRAHRAGVTVRHQVSDPVDFSFYGSDFGRLGERRG